MSSIYIHIPFCKSRCNYCDFYKDTYRAEYDGFTEAVMREMEFRSNYLKQMSVDTMYFGGGTPSLLHPSDLQKLIDKARNIWEFDEDMEITAEVNPDDATEEYIKALAETDVNRISFGIQSFIDRDLTFMGRRHNAEQTVAAVLLAKKYGFKNITVDLIYGIPGMSAVEWEKNVLKAVVLDVDHISAYMLTIEPGTPLAAKLNEGGFVPVSDEECEEQYLTAHRLLGDAGFEHYEVSNFARDPYYRSRHNSNYWCGSEYLGLGPSAVSYNGKSRSTVVPDVEKYIKEAGTHEIYETEGLSQLDRYNEYVMISLRTSKGVERDVMTRRFGTSSLLFFEYKAQKFLAEGLMVREGNEYKIPPEKWTVSDAIIRDLFSDEE